MRYGSKRLNSNLTEHACFIPTMLWSKSAIFDRRKREMELMEKECAISADRIQELRISLATLHQQEEQLRMQQQTIRSQLAAGIKPDDSLSLPAIFHVLGGQQDPVGREDAEQAALNAMLQAQMGTLGGAPMEAV